MLPNKACALSSKFYHYRQVLSSLLNWSHNDMFIFTDISSLMLLLLLLLLLLLSVCSCIQPVLKLAFTSLTSSPSWYAQNKGVIFNLKHVCVCASSGWVTFANVKGYWKSLRLTLFDNMAITELIAALIIAFKTQSTQTIVIFNPKHVCVWRAQQRKQLPEPFDLFRERKRVYVWPQTVFENQTVRQTQTCFGLKITP